MVPTPGVAMARRLKLTCPTCSVEFEVNLDELSRQKEKVIYRSAASLPEVRGRRAHPQERISELIVKCPNGHQFKIRVPEA